VEVIQRLSNFYPVYVFSAYYMTHPESHKAERKGGGRENQNKEIASRKR
jgi:hypothetical protein